MLMRRNMMFGWMQLATDVQTFNEVYGPTCNSYNPELLAGGSSGGCHESMSPNELSGILNALNRTVG
jgi:hypothetical protein